MSYGYNRITVRNMLASYSHFHPLAYPNLPANFVKSCLKFKEKTAQKKTLQIGAVCELLRCKRRENLTALIQHSYSLPN
jgi:hypothetical protein